MPRLADVAREAAQAAGSARTVEVIGDGAIAAEVKRLLGGVVKAGGKEAPDGVVETSGTPDALVSAMERVADGGVVVLAGPTDGQPYPVNLYADAHLRGLTIVGVAPPDQEG